jgi:uncharacterized protein YegL
MEEFNPILDDLMDIVGGDKSVTYVCFIQDHSGSMKQKLIDSEQSRADIQMSNYNEQMVVLRRESENDMETLVTLIEFDDKVKVRYQNVPAAEAIDLADYWTGGMTALYDAVGQGIHIVEEELEKDSRPNKAALVIIQTDGLENISKEYTQKILKDKIAELEDTGIWTFVFLGENLDVQLTADFSAGNTLKMEATRASYTVAGSTLADNMSDYYTARKRGVTKTENMMVPPPVTDDRHDPKTVEEFAKLIEKYAKEKEERGE